MAGGFAEEGEKAETFRSLHFDTSTGAVSEAQWADSTPPSLLFPCCD